MKLRNFVGLGLAALAGLSLASCGGNNENGGGSGTGNVSTEFGAAASGIGADYAPKTDKLLVWGPDTQQEVLKKLSADWVEYMKTIIPNFNVKVEVGMVAETEVSTNLANDLAACADVFAFANDNLVKFVSAGYLAQQGGARLDYVKENNDPNAIKAATAPNNNIYAYPITGDNGYFLMYDKSVFTADDVDKFSSMWAKASSQKRVHLDLDDSWYDAGFFFGTGCSYTVTYNENLIETDISCDFNDPTKGMAAGRAIYDIYKQGDKLLNGGNAELQSAVTSNTVAASITGTWNAPMLMEKWGDNFEATKLPKFTVDGKDYQMGSFNGYKLMGVNKASKDAALANSLAAYLTCKESQIYRYEQTKVSPSIEAARDEAEGYDTDKCAAALTLQASLPTARVQESVPSNYWTAVETFGKEIIQGEITLENMQDKLNQMVKLIESITE